MAIPQSTPTPSYSIPASPAHSTASSRFNSTNNSNSNGNGNGNSNSNSTSDQPQPQPPSTTPSNAASLSSGFSNLLKNARRSTDSLRSARSFGRNRNKKSLEISSPSETPSTAEQAPPMPSIQHLDKPLPVPQSSPSLPPSPRVNLSFNDDAAEELRDLSKSSADQDGVDPRDSLDDSVLTHETGGIGPSQAQVVSGRKVDLRSITSYQDIEDSQKGDTSYASKTSSNGNALVAGPRSRVHSWEAARPASEMIDPMTNAAPNSSSNVVKSTDPSSSQVHQSGGPGSQASSSVRAISPSLSNVSKSTRDDSHDSAYTSTSANESQQSQGLNVNGVRHQASSSSMQGSNAGSVRSNGKPPRRLSLSNAASRSRTSLANLGARMGGSSRNGSKIDLDGAGSASAGISSDDVRKNRDRDGSRSITPTRERMQNSGPMGGRTTPTQSSIRGESLGNSSNNKSSSGTTVAQLYAVFGLPKDPSVWTLAEEDCVAGVHHIEGAVGRFWRPEVLGCSICPSPAEVAGKDGSGGSNGPDGRPGSSSSKTRKPSSVKSGTAGSGAAGKWEGRGSDGKKPSNPKFIEMADGRGGVEKAETARVLSKALKLSFTREVEIVSGEGNYPPPSSCHTFSFSVPTITTSAAPSPEAGIVPGASSTESGRRASAAGGVSLYKTNAASAVGEGYGLEPAGRSAPAGMGGTGIASAGTEESSLATFFGVVLTVWSAADERRTRAVKRELGRAAKARTDSSRKKRGANGWAASGEADANAETDDGNGASGDSYSFLPANNVLFMPYAICIVSRYPIYNLLSDWNRVAWHKYSRNIEMHNQLMSTILRHPAPRLGETFLISATTDALAARRAASGGGESEDDVVFKCAFPGAMEWGRGVISIDFTMWPLFKTLSIDNILTICEIALAPSGRVLFQSRHPALLGLAVETIKYLVELRGWKGVSNQNCHARDVRIYLEDPGNWIIAINTELRSIAKPSGEICVVDLDINFVNCPSPPPGALSTKAAREKRRRKLVSVLGFSTADYGPPREFVDAYPGGRFRPLSQIANSNSKAALDRLEDPSWWDQGAIIAAFDKVLHENSKTTFLQKVLKNRASRAAPASQSEVAAILALRRRASTFVDARDGLENKIGRLNKRLAFLMSESDMWRAQFEKIQTLVDRLTREANDLRSKVDKERRESRRLSGALAQRDIEQVQLQIQLKETEQAREAARNEMKRMKAALDTLEYEREAMMDEIRNVVSGSGEQDIEMALSRYDMSSDGGHSRTSSPSTSQFSHTPSQTAELIARSRANAEARINQGPGRRSRSGSELRHGAGSAMSHESSSGNGRDRSGKKSPTQSSAQNHFTDDQMNYEIQSRTSVVTDQISKIQAQLENTLSNLEGRRSGTFDRNERRGRRTSTSSVNSNRWERYDTSSNASHGGERSASVSTDNPSNGYDAVESLSASESEAPVSPMNGSKVSNPSRSKGSTGAPPPSSFKPPPSVQPKSSARQRVHSNPWKEAAAQSSPSLHNKSSSSSLNFNNQPSSSPQPDQSSSSAEPSPTHAEPTASSATPAQSQ